MPDSPNLKAQIHRSLHAFTAKPLKIAASDFFKILGYSSSRTMNLGSVAEFLLTFDPAKKLLKFEPEKNWQSIQLIFQLTGEDISNGTTGQLSLLPPEAADLRKIESYLFVAIDLKPLDDRATSNRAELCEIAREINRLFSMPVLILFRYVPHISLAFTYRRVNKKEASKDVIGQKVTIIKDVSCESPHSGHLTILEDFSLPSLGAFRGRDIRTFPDLDSAWRESLSTELLRRRAYRMLADWYFWARDHAQFPESAELDADGKPSLQIIRLLTRIIFCWFVKEKKLPNGCNLIPLDLFDLPRIREILQDSSPQAFTYYTAILQNLFFASLNTEMDKEGEEPQRRFVRTRSAGYSNDYMVHSVWRHKEQLCDPEAFSNLLRSVPFLNGGLFECLDDNILSEESDGPREIREDGFSTKPSKQARIPNFLFFGDKAKVDLSAAYGGSVQKDVFPLLNILHSFVWTITERTPLEEEVALDPDLLGNVFENLLASYNPETDIVARNATGSFYTPDYVVDWMIEQALIPYLRDALPESSPEKGKRVSRLLDWDETGHDFNPAEIERMVSAISRLKALDPACGSGAFPMGLLKKAVKLLSKLDPDNQRWKRKQIEAAESIESSSAREAALEAIEKAFSHDHDNYGRKLFLIENCLFGVDIQPIAVQISKLRFFISLIVDQPVEEGLYNYGILPLPNLETKIVAANTLIGLKRGQLLLGAEEVIRLERELQQTRHQYFTARRYSKKKELRQKDKELCGMLAKALAETGQCSTSDAKRLVSWNPYNTNTAAGFFDPVWMYGFDAKQGGFDIIIGNPPYVRQEELKNILAEDSEGRQRPFKDLLKEQYRCYTGTADLYVYFFERSFQLLRVGGLISFITSNKFFRAAYGEKLRSYILYTSAPLVLLDFGDTNVFTAISYPAIIVAQKTKELKDGKLPDASTLEDETRFNQLIKKPDHHFRIFTWRAGLSKQEVGTVFEQQSTSLALRDLRPSGWRLESPVRLRLLDRIRAAGTPLGEYCNGRFYRGILTGLNEAFVVDRETRDLLIAEHPSSAEVLKPFLRGRDVKRWRCEPQDIWLIFTRRGVDIKKYPAILKHLSHFKKRLTPGIPGGRKPGSYEWYEIQDNIAYWQEFEQHKIVYPDIAYEPNFTIDSNQLYPDCTLFLIPNGSKLLLAVLNSAINLYFFQRYVQRFGAGICGLNQYMLIKCQFLSQITPKIFLSKT